MSKDIGDKIKNMRQQKNLSQHALAQKAGIAQSTLSGIEKNARQPQLATLQALCAAMGITIFELFSCGEDVNASQFFKESIRLADGALNARSLEQHLYVLYLKGRQSSPVRMVSVCESENLT